MTKIATVFGGSGFAGRYIAQRLAREGWRVRVAVRHPNHALFVRTYGILGQVEPVYADLRKEASVAAAMAGVDAVVNCVGIMHEVRGMSFEAIHVKGAERVAGLAAKAGVKRMVHLSALGADPASESRYARSKAEGEAAVLRHFPEAAILRPSVMFGPEDAFFNRFANMARFTPLLPVVGARTRFQPIYVDDVARAAVQAIEMGAGGIYELGGPDIETFRQLMERMLEAIRRRRIILDVPFWAAGAMAAVLDGAQFLSGGLWVNRILTRDQVKLLRRDNVVSGEFPGLADLGIDPVAMEAILDTYLWVWRPEGQYTAIREGLARLR